MNTKTIKSETAIDLEIAKTVVTCLGMAEKLNFTIKFNNPTCDLMSEGRVVACLGSVDQLHSYLYGYRMGHEQGYEKGNSDRVFGKID